MIIPRIGANDLGMRICSLFPSATEIAFALGLGDEVVGVTHECDYPPEARKRRIVVRSVVDPDRHSSSEIDRLVREHLRAKRSLYAIDLPSLQEANPDFILTQDLCDVCAVDYNEVVAATKSLSRKPQIIPLNPTLLTDVLRDIERIGAATGKEREARGLVSRLRERIERVRSQTSRLELRPRVACIEWLDPLYCAGHWIPEMVELAGGVDGLGEKGKPSKEIRWEAVRALEPEVVVIMPCGFHIQRTLGESALLHRREGWNELPAVKSGKVFAVNGSAYFNRPGPRLVDGLEILAQIIHPEIFPWQTSSEATQRLD